MNTRGRITVRGANRLMFVVLIMQFVVSFAVSAIMLLIYGLNENLELIEKEMIHYVLVGTQIFAVFLPTIIYLISKRVPLSETLRLKPLRFTHGFLILILGITGQFIAQILNIPILIVFELLGELPPSPIPIPHNTSELMLSLLIVGVLPAVFEEILMRGTIMRAYEIRGTRSALLISALFFGIIHGDLKNLLGPIFFGLIFGYFVLRTGSLFAGILAHFANNSFAMIFVYLQENFSNEISFLQTPIGILSLYGIGIMVFIGAFILFVRTTNWETKPPIATVKQDLQAGFINPPMIMTVVVYIILQIIMIMEVMN